MMLVLLLLYCLGEVVIFSFGVTAQTEKKDTGSEQIVAKLVTEVHFFC